ncbi:MAG: hypothetical protein ABI041_04300 [Bdellovibrionia bacterium]
MKRQYLSYLTICASVFLGVLQLPAFADTMTNPEMNMPTSRPSVESSVSISTATLPQGEYLVDQRGMSLYMLDATRQCDAECERVWPPLVAMSDNISAAGRVSASSVGSIPRADGTKQVTYNGMPLYLFAQDRAPGDIMGQGIEDVWGVWNLIRPDGMRLMVGSLR